MASFCIADLVSNVVTTYLAPNIHTYLHKYIRTYTKHHIFLHRPQTPVVSCKILSHYLQLAIKILYVVPQSVNFDILWLLRRKCQFRQNFTNNWSKFETMSCKKRHRWYGVKLRFNTKILYYYWLVKLLENEQIQQKIVDWPVKYWQNISECICCMYMWDRAGKQKYT